MITAEEARNLTNSAMNSELTAIEELIVNNAKEGRSFIFYPSLDGDIKAHLQESGYFVEYDDWLKRYIISW